MPPAEPAVAVVVVPHTPGPLLHLDAAAAATDGAGPGPALAGGPADGRRRRDRDDLDDLIDELFPDTDESPGAFDAAVLAAGAALVGWAAAADGPGWALAVGVGGLALGLVLPMRWAWRRAAASRARRRRAAVLARGVPLRTDDEAVAALARAYADLLAVAPVSPGAAATSPGPAAAAHGAALEVATLLGGRPVGSPAERTYVTTRTAAIADLAAALRLRPTATAAPDGDPGPAPELVAEARLELDALAPGGALARLTDLTAETNRAPD